MTGVDLAALRTLAEQATPGPWVKGYWPLPEPTHYVGAIDPDEFSSRMREQVTGPAKEQDVAFIATCDPQTVLALVEAVEAARRFYQEAPPPDDPPSVRSWGGPTYRILHRALGAALAPFRQEQP